MSASTGPLPFGTRVRIKFPGGYTPTGTIISILTGERYDVRLDERFVGLDDDGVREVSIDDLEVL